MAALTHWPEDSQLQPPQLLKPLTGNTEFSNCWRKKAQNTASVGTRAEVQVCGGQHTTRTTADESKSPGSGSRSGFGSTRTHRRSKVTFHCPPTALSRVTHLCVSLGRNRILQTNHYRQLQVPLGNYLPLLFACFEVRLSQCSCPQVLPSPHLWGEAAEKLQPTNPTQMATQGGTEEAS